MDQNHNPQFVVQRRLSPGQKPAPKVQVQATHTAAADSDAESDIEEDQEELVKDKEVPPEVEDFEAEYDAESVHINGDEYVTVDIYDNEYYTREDDEEHLFALTEYQGDTCVQMRRITLQKAADKLHRPQYTPQEKECLVTYVEVNRYPAWTLWDSGSTTTGITPQFAHVNAIHIHLVEDLVTDEEEQSAASALETTKSERSFWDRPVGPPDIQWAYDPHMPPEWNEAVASMMIKNRVALLQTIGEVYCQPTADEISEPLNIFVDGTSLKVKSVSWLTTLTVSQPPVWLKMEDTGEAHLRALRERFEPARQAHQKRVDIGKDKPRKLSEDDFP
ncbi:hypothetical protein C0995_009080 [Termitomyces sp. Mi166|nr:hypothetical protein C0995_009080 [Termitomyces sp. Mi166\